jgi:hypothetical protein
VRRGYSDAVHLACLRMLDNLDHMRRMVEADPELLATSRAVRIAQYERRGPASRAMLAAKLRLPPEELQRRLGRAAQRRLLIIHGDEIEVDPTIERATHAAREVLLDEIVTLVAQICGERPDIRARLLDVTTAGPDRPTSGDTPPR